MTLMGNAPTGREFYDNPQMRSLIGSALAGGIVPSSSLAPPDLDGAINDVITRVLTEQVSAMRRDAKTLAACDSADNCEAESIAYTLVANWLESRIV